MLSRIGLLLLSRCLAGVHILKLNVCICLLTLSVIKLKYAMGGLQALLGSDPSLEANFVQGLIWVLG